MSVAAPASDPDAASTRLGLQLEQVVLKRLQDDKLVLPTMPAVASKCLELVNKSDFNLNKIASIIETDPVFAARILRTANSAGMATRSPATNVQAAVVRLGQRNLRSLVLEASLGGVFESRDRRIAEAARAIWNHSLAVAMLARDIGILVNVESEDCYLAGLLHDIGKPVLAVLLLEAEKQIATRTSKPWIGSEAWMQCLQRSHRVVGIALARQWQLPGLAASAIEDQADYDNENRVSVGNVVRFSNAICKQQGLYVGAFDAEEVGAMVMIGRSLLQIEDDNLVRIVGGLKDKVAARLKT